ncbi:MAG TPA: cytochrome c-type biogenesis CcmF C-terminal domain-containing protein, partial [Steroidobacteraceae bacterium]|nr:cytochrome c-type biogenesis CcmF C-terminal domain-containing protein [Steroidobacteraceae bacterium]
VRSGVLTSVHAFATDPARGMFVLGFLILCIGGALTLYAWRAPKLASSSGFELWSRESFLLFNNILLVIAAGLILLGTLYPIFIDWLQLGKVSVGPPYFNLVFLAPTLPLIALLGVGMHAAWKRARLAEHRRPLWIGAAAALVLAVIVVAFGFGRVQLMAIVGLTAALWLMYSSLREPIARLRAGHSLSASVLGMSIAHFGVALFVLGVTGVESYRVERDVAMKPGDSVELSGYTFTFRDTRNLTGPNYLAIEGQFDVKRGEREVATLRPQKRVYRVQRNPMTEAGIEVGWTRDLFVAMGEDLGAGAWSVRLQYKPLIRYIWLGALVMALGGLIAITDRRYRTVRVKQEAAAGGALPAGESA